MPTEMEQSGERMQSTGPPVALLFINTTHPSDATTRGSLSQIRSHVAKEIRSRVRRSRRAMLPPGDISRNKSHEQLEKNVSDRLADTRACLALVSGDGHEDVEPRLPGLASSPSDPYQAMGPSRAAQIWGSVRPFSDKENFLFDHYLNYIVPFSNGSCHRNKGSSGAALIAIQLNYWIPFALSDLGLIAALFLQSCLSLGVLNPCQNYADMSTEYRLQCIQSTNAALSTHRAMQISDATIAKVMIMASDEFTFGNLDGWSAHMAAVTQMIKMRGGVDALGVGGFLKEVIVNTPIYYEY
ncbi:hypothetical protein BP6252_07380 [Coleophoma cylindrospora]|uniref:Transcription factor domain-containing protein n=1 Tax=Coleophoma cylindrospora TaxID=1849047 RepID=A0A3D8RHE6_9HELO|nr:hypothetical protein BP6252_07380 [Coleophoma cylindrospora]